MPRESDRRAVRDFVTNPVDRPMLGLVYGRRRIGKSTLLVEHSRDAGFYYEATRVAGRVQLERLGAAIGAHLGTGRLALDDWEEAIDALLRLADGAASPVPIVLDEFGHILEDDPSVPSMIAAALGPSRRAHGPARLVLCGSAITLMRSLTAGESALRGRAALELVMQPDDFRTAATRLSSDDHALAIDVYAVIGGVVGYATDMVGFDLPCSPGDFDDWVVRRVLSPAATLHHEATTLLVEDPSLTGSRPSVHHSILAAIANGSVSAGQISKRLGKPVSNLAPALNRLVDAGFVTRHLDPLRDQRPTYRLADPFLQFHYAVIEPNGAALRDLDPAATWASRLRHTFDAQVRGPVFEEMARSWVRRHAAPSTVSDRDHVGPTVVTVGGVTREIDVVATGAGELDARQVAAIGEAKAGEPMTVRHVERLQQARAAMGDRALDARLLLFGRRFAAELVAAAADIDGPGPVELVDVHRLYTGS